MKKISTSILFLLSISFASTAHAESYFPYLETDNTLTPFSYGVAIDEDIIKGFNCAAPQNITKLTPPYPSSVNISAFEKIANTKAEMGVPANNKLVSIFPYNRRYPAETKYTAKYDANGKFIRIDSENIPERIEKKWIDSQIDTKLEERSQALCGRPLSETGFFVGQYNDVLGQSSGRYQYKEGDRIVLVGNISDRSESYVLYNVQTDGTYFEHVKNANNGITISPLPQVSSTVRFSIKKSTGDINKDGITGWYCRIGQMSLSVGSNIRNELTYTNTIVARVNNEEIGTTVNTASFYDPETRLTGLTESSAEACLGRGQKSFKLVPNTRGSKKIAVGDVVTLSARGGLLGLNEEKFFEKKLVASDIGTPGATTQNPTPAIETVSTPTSAPAPTPTVVNPPVTTPVPATTNQPQTNTPVQVPTNAPVSRPSSVIASNFELIKNTQNIPQGLEFFAERTTKGIAGYSCLVGSKAQDFIYVSSLPDGNNRLPFLTTVANTINYQATTNKVCKNLQAHSFVLNTDSFFKKQNETKDLYIFTRGITTGGKSILLYTIPKTTTTTNQGASIIDAILSFFGW